MIRRFRYTLKLPDDDVKRRQLFIKSRQYDERMATFERRILAGSDIDLVPLWHHYEYRQAILHHLFHEGKIDLGQLQRELEIAGHLDEPDISSWFTACLVIIDYCLYDGKHVSGGSGLPDVKPKPHPK